jgi:hypothetical protein
MAQAITPTTTENNPTPQSQYLADLESRLREYDAQRTTFETRLKATFNGKFDHAKYHDGTDWNAVALSMSNRAVELEQGLTALHQHIGRTIREKLSPEELARLGQIATTIELYPRPTAQCTMAVTNSLNLEINCGCNH